MRVCGVIVNIFYRLDFVRAGGKIMRMKQKLLLGFASILVAILSSGCAAVIVGGAAAAGAGTYAYVSGQLKTSEAVTYERAQTAASAGLSDLGYSITATEHDAIKTRYIARGSGDKKVTVTVEKISGTVSEFRIRVGTFGDAALSVAIMDAIKKRL
jgi:hypothetical protein